MRHFETISENGSALLDRPPGREWAEEVEEDLQPWVRSSSDSDEALWLLLPERTTSEWEVDDSDLRREFDELASAWERDTSMVSFLPQKAMHWAYQRIIGKGQPVVPIILERLRDRGPHHWFWALAMITGDDPARGTTTLREAADAWLAWGRDRGLI